MQTEENPDSEQEIVTEDSFKPKSSRSWGFSPSSVEYFDTREAALADGWSDTFSLSNLIASFKIAIPYIAMFSNMAVFIYWFVAAFMPMAMNQWGAERFTLPENLTYALLVIPLLGVGFFVAPTTGHYKTSMLFAAVAFLIADSF